jgi:phytoene desaturase
MTKPSVIIIGAGIGGLSTAILLAKKGFQVTILEKNPHAGGRCGLINKGGHIFDTGPTMYIFPQIYRQFFSLIGENIDDHLKLLRADPTYRLHFPDQSTFTLSHKKSLMEKQLEALEPGAYQSYLKYLKVGRTHYHLALDRLINRDFSHPFEYFTPANLFRLLKTQAIIPHAYFVKQFFKHPHLLAAFTFQDSYLGLNPFTSPSIYSLFTYTEQTEGSYLPQGGMYQIIKVLEKIALKAGVEIRYHALVKKINLHQNLTTGVTLTNGSILKADYLISNAGQTYTYQHLLPPGKYTQKLIKKRHSCSALIYHWAFDIVYPDLHTHNLFFSGNYQQSFSQVIDKLEPPSEPHFYIQAPARTDPNRAPKGQDTLTVMVPINHLHENSPVNWPEYQNKIRRYILKYLKQAGYKDIESHLKFEITHNPLDWQRYLNLPFGSVYGLHHHLRQLGYLRPSRRHPRYSNLFFVGADNHPGSGLPTILRSAQFTATAVIKQACF